MVAFRANQEGVMASIVGLEGLSDAEFSRELDNGAR